MSSKPKPPEGYRSSIEEVLKEADGFFVDPTIIQGMQRELADLRRAKELLQRIVACDDLMNDQPLTAAIKDARAYLAAEQEQRDGT